MPDKRYLTGIDWVINVLDAATRKKTGCGNISQVVLELETTLDENKLRANLEVLLKNRPVLYGRPGRDWNLAPYWKIPLKVSGYNLPLRIIDLKDNASEGEILEGLSQGFLDLSGRKNEYVFFLYLKSKYKSYFAMTFDHRLLDAYGAELFLSLLDGNSEEKQWLGYSCQGPYLSAWRDKFAAGKRVNREFLKLAQGNSVRAIDLEKGDSKRKAFFKIIAFDEAQTAKIIDKAYDCAGYLLLMPYLLAVVLKNIDAVFVSKKVEGEDYLIPVSVDMRSSENISREVFFNYLSFIFFKINKKDLSNFPSLINCIKNGFYEQVKSSVALDIYKASFLMRILPLPVLGFLMGVHFKGKMASLGFSHVREGGFTLRNFMGSRILNFFHMPRVPAPPGFGIFFNQYNGRLNAAISYLDGIFSNREVDSISGNIKKDLLG